MMSLLPLGIGAAMFATLFFMGMAWRRLSDWRPAVAMLRASDYGDNEQEDDRGPFRRTRWGDGERRTEMDISYTDETGRERRAQIVRYVARGDILDRAFPIWYRRDDPDTASPTGPFAFLFFALCAGLCTAIQIAVGLGWVRGG